MSKQSLKPTNLHSTITNSDDIAIVEKAEINLDMPSKAIVTFGENISGKVSSFRLATPSPQKIATTVDYPIGAASASFGSEKILEVVFGDDDREPIKNVLESPWRKIAALRIRSKSGRIYVGTGWFINRRVVITAGHCVYLHDDRGWPDSIEVIPALDGSDSAFGSYSSKNFKSNDGWVRDRNSDYDYGAIVLESPATNEIGWFSFAAPPDTYLVSNIANISGYPADRDRATKQYYHSRNIVRSSSRRIYYQIDTYGGQSGSPIWMNLGEGNRVAIGIHTTGGSTSNFGTRITEELFNNLKSWKDEHQ